MKKNVGKIDMIVRVILGVLIIVAGIYYGSWLGLIGLVPLVTGLSRRCPMYMPFGFSTCKVKNS